jgi:hypothetical protein
MFIRQGARRGTNQLRVLSIITSILFFIFSKIGKWYLKEDPQGENMAGRKISDHSFWAGGHSKASVFPEGAKSKSVSDVEGAGSVMQYQDTEEKISEAQRKQIGKIRSYKQPEGERH